MSRQCEACGIAGEIAEGKFECIKYRREFVSGQNLHEDCTYFIEKQYEEGELLSPLEHLLFKEQDLKAKHMKGTI